MSGVMRFWIRSARRVGKPLGVRAGVDEEEGGGWVGGDDEEEEDWVGEKGLVGDEDEDEIRWASKPSTTSTSTHRSLSVLPRRSISRD